MNFFEQYKTALKKCGLTLLIVYSVFTFFDQGLTTLMEERLRSSDGANAMVFLFGGLYLFNNIFFMTLAAVVAIYGLSSRQNSVMAFIGDYLNQSCVEVLRGWGKILGWSLLLVIPGFIKYLQFLMVPFVVAGDPAYQEGQVDALKVSAQIFKRHWARLVFIVFGFQIVWSYFSVDFFDAYRLFWVTPLRALLISALETLVFLLYMNFLFQTFRMDKLEVKYEPTI